MIARPFWLERIKTAWQEAPIAWLSGVRRTGKTTLAHDLGDQQILYPIPIRNREDVSSPDLRKAERITPSELRAAILAVIELGHGAAQKEIPTAVARILGFKNTSAQLRYAVEGQIHKLVKQNVITDNNGMFKRAC